MSENRSLLLLSCSNHKKSDGVRTTQEGRSFPEHLLPAAQGRLFERRNEIRRMLGGGPTRLYNEISGYRDLHPANCALARGRDFGGSEAAAYLPAYERYDGRFFRELASLAPSFWQKRCPSIEIVFVSGLYGLVFWNEAIQNYDCTFNDYTKDLAKRSIRELWGSTLSESLIGYLEIQSRSAPIKAVYDLLSEELYQSLFSWEQIQGASVYHRIFKDISGPKILAQLPRILAKSLPGFADGTYQAGWHEITDAKGMLKFGFEFPWGTNTEAMREGDLEKLVWRSDPSRLPTLFVEGESDVVILTAAWQAFHPTEAPPVTILAAGGTRQMESLAGKGRALRQVLGDRLVFALADNDREGRELVEDGHTKRGGRWRQQTNGIHWCLLAPTREFEKLMKRFGIPESFWPFTIENAFPATLRRQAIAGGAYAVEEAVVQAAFHGDPGIVNKALAAAHQFDRAGDDAVLYFRPPAPDAKLAFAQWVAAPERRDRATFAAFGAILDGLQAILARQPHDQAARGRAAVE